MTTPAQDRPDQTEEPVPTILEQMGGISGLVYSSVPVLVFVAVNAFAGMTAAIWGSLGVAALIAVVRVVRKQPIMPAVSGFFGVAVAAFIAYQTGSAKGFFLFGIWASLVYGGVFLLSVLVRWPLVGVIWSTLEGHGNAWRRDRVSLLGYDTATMAFVLVFVARFVVQHWLYEANLTGWLAFAKIAMGYPLFGLALLVTVWAVRRAEQRAKDIEETETALAAEEEERLRVKYGENAAQ